MQLTESVTNKQQQSAYKIQRLWRSYTNRKIYKYYRDIIMFKCKGHPGKLLKGINPLQAQLLQNAVNCHVRFRLGGQIFPPNIYYKIFSKSNVIDINAFAPRDYSSLPRQLAPEQKIKMTDYQQHRKQYQNEGWYLRNDNNGWRPISHKMFIKTDYVELYSGKKVNFYHHKKQLRDQKYYKKQRIAKLKWLKNLYKKGKNEEQAHLLQKIQQAQQNNKGQYYAEQMRKQSPEKMGKQIDVQSQQFEKQWSQNLDYDEYVKDWYYLSTSENSANFVPKFINSDTHNILI